MVQLAQLSPKAKRLLKQAHDRASGVTDTTLHERGVEWQQIDHSVLIVGWGTDPVTDLKYWIVRNSFGERFGEHGDFLAERGTNFMRIEGQSSAYDPILCSEGDC